MLASPAAGINATWRVRKRFASLTSIGLSWPT